MMSNPGTASGKAPSLTERRIERIVNARSVTVGLAVTFVALAMIGGIVMRVVDSDNFPNVGLGVWWALQTVTTVGYGDVVPTTDAGRIVGGIEMVLGIAFIAFVTAGVTSTVIQRGEVQARDAAREQRTRNTQAILDALTQTTLALSELDRRLDMIESKLARPS